MRREADTTNDRATELQPESNQEAADTICEAPIHTMHPAEHIQAGITRRIDHRLLSIVIADQEACQDTKSNAVRNLSLLTALSPSKERATIVDAKFALSHGFQIKEYHVAFIVFAHMDETFPVVVVIIAKILRYPNHLLQRVDRMSSGNDQFIDLI